MPLFRDDLASEPAPGGLRTACLPLATNTMPALYISGFRYDITDFFSLVPNVERATFSAPANGTASRVRSQPRHSRGVCRITEPGTVALHAVGAPSAECGNRGRLPSRTSALACPTDCKRPALVPLDRGAIAV
jgi:hypothetical protein